ncbi:MAG: T9SS type A sorting domain-containing protein [Candidatus Cloacimonetes bacterium]|nr:T9SS type A sorting domain-containing protein [Candidatus Cloacimonadota bacterium]
MKKALLTVIGIITMLMLTMSLTGTLLINPDQAGGFELGDGSFGANGWTLVNGTQVNYWATGTAAPGYSGNRAAFVTNNGTNWTYTLSTASNQVVYFWREVTFPGGEGDIQLTFDYRGTGESIYDYLRVFLVPTTQTITAGTLLSTGRIGLEYYNLTPDWIKTGITISASEAGQTRRLVFCWRNDTSTGYNPPLAIDNIKLTSNPSTPLSGTYYIDNTQATGGQYFNNFVDAILSLNNNGVTGSSTFHVTSGQTFKNYPPHITATGTPGALIAFQKSGSNANPKIQCNGHGSTTPIRAAIAIGGGDYFTFDGIDIELLGGVETSLGVFTYPLEHGYYIYNAAAGNGAQSNTIKNSKIVLDRRNTSTRPIYQNVAVTPTSAAGANSSNVYDNIVAENVNAGIYLRGNATWPDNACQIKNSIMGSTTANDIGNSSAQTWGIRVDSGSNTTIDKNIIRNVTGTSTSAVDGIFVSNTGSSTVSVGLQQISNNRVYNLNNTNTGAGRVCGIRASITNHASSSSRIFNNMIWGLNSASTSTTSRRIIGILAQDTGSGTAGANNVDFNSVLIDHSNLATVSAAYEIGTTSGSIIRTRNNIFANFTASQTGSAYHVAWASTATNLIGNAGSISDNNVLYIHNTSNGYVGRGSATNYSTLIDWQTAMSNDLNSRGSNPRFDSANPLYIVTDIATPVEGNGSFFGGAIDWVLYDIDGNRAVRSDPPDIGAHEGNFEREVECVPPLAQPTALILVPASTSIAGSFTASDAEAYLVVRHTDSSHDTPPTDRTWYSAGNDLGNGRIVSASASTSFTASGLTEETLYYFTVYAYNTSGLNAPAYLTADPLTGSMQTLPPVPDQPGSLTATALSYTVIQINATANANDNNIMVAWNTTSSFGVPLSSGYTVGQSITGGGTVLYMGPASGFPINHPDRSEGTTYYYRAWSYITAERATYYVFSSLSRSANATTPLTPVSVPHTQDFEVISAAGQFPTGWTQAGTRWSSQVSIPSPSYNRGPRSGTDYLTCMWSSTTSDWMFSRGISLEQGRTYDLGIWYNTDGYTGWTSFKMSIGTTATGGGMTTQLAIVNSPINMAYQQLTGSFSPPDNGVYYVGFQVIATGNPWYMSFDDFSIDIAITYPLPPTTPSPAHLSTGRSLNQDLGWVNHGTTTKVDVYFSTNQTAVINKDVSARVASNQTSPLNSYELPALDYSTTYYWRIVAKNDIDETADSDVWQFATMADPTIYELPHITTLSEAVPAENWYQVNSGTGITPRWGTNSSANAGGTAPEFRCAWQSVNPGTTRLVSPPVFIDGLTTLVVKYRQQIDDYAAGCTFKFRYSFDETAFTNLWTQASAGDVTYPAEEKVYTLDLTQAEFEGKERIFFGWEIEGNLFQFDYWYIDNVKFLHDNNEINQTIVAGNQASVVIPVIEINGVPQTNPTTVNITPLTNGAVVNASVTYQPSHISTPVNAGLTVMLSGTDFNNSTVTVNHNLGFIPMEIGYRLGNGPLTIVPEQPGWTDISSFFDIYFEGFKGPDDVYVFFPMEEDQPLPVDLSSFTAVLTAEMFVRLAWTAESENNHLGYNVLRSNIRDLESALTLNPSLITDGTSNGTQINYVFTDTEIENNNQYYYWLESVSLNGHSQFYGPLTVTVGDPGDDPGTPDIPLVTALLNAYPNPFNPSTAIRYSLKEATKVNVVIFNLKGQVIRHFKTDHATPGFYQFVWDGKDSKGNAVSSGVYFYRMTAGKYTSTKKLMLVK